MTIDDTKQDKFRLTHYNFNAWQIDQYGERINPRTKESTWTWKALKYPGRLENAAKVLLDCYIGQNEYTEVQELIKAIDAAQKNAIESLKTLTIERKSE